MVLPLLLALTLAGGAGSTISARDLPDDDPEPAEQQSQTPPLDLEVLDGGEVSIRLGNVLSDPALVDAVESGLPLRFEIVTQLWRDGFFDSQTGQVRWRANVFFDALEGQYVLQVEGGETDGEDQDEADDDPPARTFSTMNELQEALPRTIEPGLEPEEEGSFYYLSRLSIETLSLSDLEELRRWLRGDLAPAISGDGDVGGAAERGLRRTVIRLLGMPTRRFDARTPTFEHTTPGD